MQKKTRYLLTKQRDNAGNAQINNNYKMSGFWENTCGDWGDCEQLSRIEQNCGDLGQKVVRDLDSEQQHENEAN